MSSIIEAEFLSFDLTIFFGKIWENKKCQNRTARTKCDFGIRFPGFFGQYQTEGKYNKNEKMISNWHFHSKTIDNCVSPKGEWEWIGIPNTENQMLFEFWFEKAGKETCENWPTNLRQQFGWEGSVTEIPPANWCRIRCH